MALTSARPGSEPYGEPLAYDGAFDPDLDLARLSRRALATLGREWMLHGHLQDRAGMPLYLARTDRERMESLAIDEWMSASPIYTRRTQRALGFQGDDIPTLFKGLQLDIGAPHQFLDFRFRVTDATHGEFWLDHCGALMDVEPMGEDFVVGMCHHIEDPTFDATATAVNPRARVRPVHRPPRVPADRHPHCRWACTVDADAEPLAEHPNLAVMRRSRIAGVPTPAPTGGGEDGRPDYRGEFDPDFQLEDLSAGAQATVLAEFAVQSHLLARAYMLCVAQRSDEETAVDLGYRTLTGLAGITAERITAAAGLGGQPGPAMAKLLQLHPVFHPRSYIDARIEVLDERRCRLAVGPCPALEEDDPFHWLACIDRRGTAPLDAIVRAVDPRARAAPAEPRPGERRAYEAVVDPGAAPRPEPPEMALVRISTGAGFRFARRR